MNLYKKFEPNAYATFFFPSIIIGKKVERGSDSSITKLLVNVNVKYNPVTYKAFETYFNKDLIIINKDGLIAVVTDNKPLALAILNTIMAMGVLDGLGLFAVREHELIHIVCDLEKKVILGAKQFKLPGNTPRGKKTVPSDYEPQPIKKTSVLGLIREPTIKEIDDTSKIVAIDTMKKIIENATIIYNNGKTAELLLLSEAHTHLNNGEYAQSFTMSWNIIERHISELWTKILIDRQIDKARKQKLSSSIFWSIDHLLEVLNIFGEVNEVEYDTFMYMKSKRNGFIHKQREISKEEAQACFNIGKDIIMKKLSPILRTSNEIGVIQ